MKGRYPIQREGEETAGKRGRDRGRLNLLKEGSLWERDLFREKGLWRNSKSAERLDNVKGRGEKI